MVLGANGFIGSRLAIRAALGGFNVTALDHFSRVSDRDWHSAIARVRGDVSNLQLISELASESATVVDCLPDSNPLESAKLSPRELGELERRKADLACTVQGAGRATYVYLSSGGAVYGETKGAVSTEKDPLNPVSKYGQLKAELETRLSECLEPERLLIIRPGNLFGVPLRVSRVQGLVDAALKAAISGSSLTLYGDGSMVRDYLHVDDAADAILTLIEGNRRESVFNVGSGVGVTVLEVLRIVEQISGRKIALERHPSPKGFVNFSVLNVSRLVATIGNYTPRDFRLGVEQHLALLRAGSASDHLT